jgi:hypothetical protein
LPVTLAAGPPRLKLPLSLVLANEVSVLSI